MGHGLAVALVPLGLALALAAPGGPANADGAKPFEMQNGVRVYRGPDFITHFEPAPARQQAEPAAPVDRGPAAILDPIVEIPAQPPIGRAGYRLRCRSVRSTSCALSQVSVDIPNQPLVQRSDFRSGTLVRFGTEIRDGKLVPVARVFRGGIRVHRAGIRDDLRIRVYRDRTWDARNIKVRRAGVRDDRNIKVGRAGVRDDRNIKVRRAGVRHDRNIKVHGRSRAGG